MNFCLKRFGLKIVFVICLVFLLNSCAPVYIPNSVNTPMFTEKGEFQASVFAGTSGFDGQVAYAATDHIGLMVNGNIDNFESESGSEFRESSFLEFGAGYFEKMGTNGVFEVYGGAGFGSIEGFYYDFFGQSRPEGIINANNFRAFVQPAVGWSFEGFDASFTQRITYVQISENSISRSAVFLEPAVTIKAGFENVKAVLQGGIALPLNPDRIEFDHDPIMLTFGIQGRLNFNK